MRHVLLVAAALSLAASNGQPVSAQAATDTSTTVRFGGFVDGYYAYDFNRPRTLDRAFTTQPARHNEFNVNLAHVEAVLSGPKVRGRLAVQFGTSVQSNYAGEPRVGSYSGGDVSRYIQEAVVGVKLAPALWLDGGIYLSHIGSESWISRDNPTYTRSLIADYSPYYQAGVKLTWQATSTVTAQLNVVNGWQNISETNGTKAVGARVDWSAAPKVTFTAYNLIGNEAPDTAGSQLRIFQGGSIKLVPNDKLTLMGTFDFGSQDLGDETGRWYGTSIITRVQATPNAALVARVERYADPRQVIVVTGGASAFRASGGSLGVDVTPAPKVLWRTELRALAGRDAIFPRRDGTGKTNAVLVSSLALTF
jgi:hypothetical protein